MKRRFTGRFVGGVSKTLVSLAVTLGVACSALAADMNVQRRSAASAPSALQHLLGTAGGSAKPLAGVHDPERETVTVRPGETLDSVIRRTMRGSPFRDEILRDALVARNPGAFSRGSAHRLIAGSTLWIPTSQDIVEALQLAPLLPAQVALPAVSGRHVAGSAPPSDLNTAEPTAAMTGPSSVASGLDPAALERKAWVRYPR